MKKKEIVPLLQSIVERLVKKDYGSVLTSANETRLSSSDIQEAISDYPVSLSLPPTEAYKTARFIKIDNDTYHVDFDLWSEGEPSDLTLTCIFQNDGSSISYTIEDLHVM